MRLLDRRMPAAVCLILALCAPLQAQETEARAFRVLSFKQGEMHQVDGQWSIRREAQTLTYGVNGTCVFNQESMPCMWYGYILEYDSAGRDVELSCSGHQDAPANFGNPGGLIARNVRAFSYVVPLKGNERLFINPQYTAPAGEDRIVRAVTRCSVDGVQVLQFKQTLLIPPRKG